jgi:tetratricopeptide (TPR) repeat protein
MPRPRAIVLVLLILFAAQIALASRTIAWRPAHEPIMTAPSRHAAGAIGLGDDQFFFRTGILKITHAGVTGGETIALRDFDYPALVSWFTLLDQLDPRSNAVPVLAAYWFGYTPIDADARLVVDYLVARSQTDRQTGWRWLVEAVYLARYRLNDPDLALELAHHAAQADLPNAPFYVRHLPAFIELQLGRREAAIVLLKALLEANPNLPEDQADLLLYMIGRIERDEAGGADAAGTDGT